MKLKIFFSITTEPFPTKLGTKHPWVKGIQVCSNEGPRPFQGEIIVCESYICTFSVSEPQANWPISLADTMQIFKDKRNASRATPLCKGR